MDDTALAPAIPYWAEWEDWSDCDGICRGLNFYGTHTRERKSLTIDLFLAQIFNYSLTKNFFRIITNYVFLVEPNVKRLPL